MSTKEDKKPIRLLIADDQRLVLDGIGSILSLYDEIEVCSLCANGEEAVQEAEAQQPDVALLDVRMPVMDGISAAEIIIQRKLAKAVIMLTTFDDKEYIIKALRAGAAGYLLKNLPPEELLRAIKTVNAGGFQSTLTIMGKLREDIPSTEHQAIQESQGEKQRLSVLSHRELDVLSLIGEGASNSEIATELGLSEGTVKNYVSGILDRMGFRDRIQAALYAARNHLC